MGVGGGGGGRCKGNGIRGGRSADIVGKAGVAETSCQLGVAGGGPATIWAMAFPSCLFADG